MKQKKNPKFSLGVWARKLGMSSPSMLAKILAGTRNPGEDIIPKFTAYFGFSSDEQEYFEDLIRLNRIKDDIRLKVLMMSEMEKEFPASRMTLIDQESNEVLLNWYVLAIREMTNLKDFKADPSWIRRRLLYSVDEKEIQHALNLLLTQKLIEQNADGAYAPAQGIVHTKNDVPSDLIKTYHVQNLQLAQIALYEEATDQREITSTTLSISKDKLGEAKELIRSFNSRFLTLMQEQKGEETFQLQVQFYPLTKKREEG